MSTSLFDRMLARIVRLGVLEVVHADGRVAKFGLPAPGFPQVRIRLTRPGVTTSILRDPRLGAGEAYIAGDLTIEQGDVMELAQLLRANQPWEAGAKLYAPSALRKLLRRAIAAADQVNARARSKANVGHHYDIGYDLYALMLDGEHMQYSCAYWSREDMTLGEAQEAKLAHIAAKLALKPGQQVLDIGGGWGGMAIYLAKHFDVTVTAITLSAEQLALAVAHAKAAGIGDRVKFELADYRDLPASGRRFDRIVSVGMFEHVGRPQFDSFFRICARLLTDDGVMLLHTIGRFGGPGSTDAFTRKYIFPGGYIPALSETVAASEKVRLIASDVETLRLHYARTLRAWHANCVANRAAIEALYDAKFFRMWTFYLAGATAAFESGGMGNYQIQYTRDRHALPLTRGYMGEVEAGLLESRPAPALISAD
ncbi:cyclopropane-fatty-acyl-phospholipid synthase family protein [Novosphingobium sp. Gsoil 351]|uniref:SAM-dependent methyltransferase n=1 Tax=Novosphingobium sp. Gsoil 351 TaxID=2675225 RepID=UPI0012B4CF32|nr:cyclopropane-fatty-acyl-phospholipid synthase family protein [Novosphingobium sp. Gsoil 351]QGN53765.1 methyltransferase domain-containing protein [Novosphingobium sp. Gsoil 351]